MDIQLYVPIEEIYVFADKNQLIRVFNNLIKNAIQSIPTSRRGKISIKLSKNSHYAVVTVSDNGTGIDDEMREKVFIPNFTTKNSGTGLGLAICSNIIESLDGKIYFKTEMNKGTDFTVEVPLMRMDDNFFAYQTIELSD
jgi:signal transduction histidine kinase